MNLQVAWPDSLLTASSLGADRNEASAHLCLLEGISRMEGLKWSQEPILHRELRSGRKKEVGRGSEWGGGEKGRLEGGEGQGAREGGTGEGKGVS